MSERPRILIVDDEKVGRLLLEATLDEDKYEMLLAENGRQALALAAEHNPDLILLDVMMPEQDGFEICEKIKSEEHLKDIPVLLVTALEDKDSRVRGFKAGADDYIPKPFNRMELLARVKTFTGLYKYKKLLKAKEEEKSREGKDTATAGIKEGNIQLFFDELLKISVPSKELLKKYFSETFTILNLPEGTPYPYAIILEDQSLWFFFNHSDSSDANASLLHNLAMLYFKKLVNEQESPQVDSVMFKVYNYLHEQAEALGISHVMLNMCLSTLKVETKNKMLDVASLFLPVFVSNAEKTVLFSADDYSHPQVNIDGPLVTVKEYKMKSGDTLFLIPNNIMMEFDERSFEQLLMAGQKLSFQEQKDVLEKSIEQLLKNLGHLYFVSGFQLK